MRICFFRKMNFGRPALGEISNQIKQEFGSENIPEKSRLPRPEQNLQRKLKYVPLILRKKNNLEPVEPVTNIKRIAKVAPKKPKKEINIKKEAGNNSNPYPKPPYSYMAMIQMAIQSSQNLKMTLKQIYEYIENMFPYFKHAKPGKLIVLLRFI